MLKSRNWNPRNRKQSNVLKKLVVIPLVSASIIVYFFFFNSLDLELDVAEKGLKYNSLPVEQNKLYLPSEGTFRSTIKSCIDLSTPKKCLQLIPDLATIQRIAILSPPTWKDEELNKFASLLKKALAAYFGDEGGNIADKFEIVTTSHVPPYGYGGNHGWTKIIRLFHSPILTEVMESAYWGVDNVVNSKGEYRYMRDSEQNFLKKHSRRILTQVFRQVIRWHSRLSAVAAHTALFTFDFSSEDMELTVLRLLQFVLHEPEMQRSNTKLKSIAQEMTAEVQIMSSKASSQMMAFFTDEELTVMDQVLANELKTTNNLQKWPTLPFYGAGDNEDEVESLTDVSAAIASGMSPDCDAIFTKCDVRRDRCEMKGRLCD